MEKLWRTVCFGSNRLRRRKAVEDFLAHSRHSSSPESCWMGLRSGFYAGQSGSQIPNWGKRFFMQLVFTGTLSHWRQQHYDLPSQELQRLAQTKQKAPRPESWRIIHQLIHLFHFVNNLWGLLLCFPQVNRFINNKRLEYLHDWVSKRPPQKAPSFTRQDGVRFIVCETHDYIKLILSFTIHCILFNLHFIQHVTCFGTVK